MKISICDGYIEREHVVGHTMQVDHRETESFMDALAKRTPLLTGLLPPGLLSYRQAGEHTQIALCLNPAINLICWGEHERDNKAKMLTLAQPYRVVIAETNKDQLLGARIFYSPVPIVDMDQVLYHSNLPNENHYGYRGTGVGWVCLYHTDDWSKLDIGARCAALGVRMSGNEAYNNANMRQTDGPRFYQKEYVKRFGEKKANEWKYLWDPSAWEKKSEKEGFEWTLNANLWIPVLVGGIDNQTAHLDVEKGGVPLTVGMAMNGLTNYYYQDQLTKDFHAFVRDDVDRPDTVAWAKAAFVAAEKTAAPEVVTDAPVLAGIGEALAPLPAIGQAHGYQPPVGTALPAMQ